MRLRVRPMGLQDAENCVSLLALHPEERRRYGALLEQLPAAWKRLIRTESLNSAVVEDVDGGAQIVAFGATAFISDGFLRRLKTAPLVWMGPELVCRALANDGAILSPAGIRDANSADGLNVAVWAGVTRAAGPQQQSLLLLQVARVFTREHGGYRLKEIIVQPNEISVAHVVLNMGVLPWLPSEDCYWYGRVPRLEEWIQNPFIFGSTRELAYESFGTWLSMLFSYSPPRIYFRPAEQRLLLAALRGLTDEELSDELGISRSAVKKTWLMVYDRAAAALPGEWPDRAVDDAETKRGKEKKQHLLAYLRGHMEELRPVLPPRNGAGVTRTATIRLASDKIACPTNAGRKPGGRAEAVAQR